MFPLKDLLSEAKSSMPVAPQDPRSILLKQTQSTMGVPQPAIHALTRDEQFLRHLHQLRPMPMFPTQFGLINSHHHHHHHHGNNHVAMGNPNPNLLADSARAELLQLLLRKEQEETLRRQFQQIEQTILPRGTSAKVDSLIRAAPASPRSVQEEPAAKKQKRSEEAASTEAATKRAEEKKQKAPIKKKKDTKWLVTYEKLKEYKAVNGDCIVPRGYAQDTRLASWVAEQRKQYKLLTDGKQSSITPERIALLEELNFAWNAQEFAWDRHLSDLKQFRATHGHCHVPLNHPDYPKLGLWVKEQRRHYTLMKQGKPSHMTEERAQDLDKVGFCWDTHEATWLERFKELQQFKEKHGTCIVPTTYNAVPKLGTWVHHQRRQYKKFKEGQACHITEERIRALDSIGFVWYPRDKASGDSSVSSDDASE